MEVVIDNSCVVSSNPSFMTYCMRESRNRKVYTYIYFYCQQHWSGLKYHMCSFSFFLTVFIFTVAHAMFASSCFNFLWELCHTFLLWHDFIVPTLHVLSLNIVRLFSHYATNIGWRRSSELVTLEQLMTAVPHNVLGNWANRFLKHWSSCQCGGVCIAQVESKLGWKCIFFWVMLH